MDDLRITRRVVVPAADLEMRVARSSGPGGQGVNTTDSKVELRLDLDGTEAFSDVEKARIREALGNRVTNDGVLILQANEHRSQHRNREAVRGRMANLLRDAIQPPKRRKATKPSRAAKRRRLDAKRHRGEVKKLRKSPRPE